LEAISPQLAFFSGLPWYGLFFAIILLSWLWEDAAVIFAALLALDARISISAAFLASVIGIASGDLGLYALGRLSRRWRRLRGLLLLSRRSRLLRQRFRRRTLSNIFIIRFIPGLRTVGFTFCGVWRVPAWRFTAAMIAACLLWVLTVFSVINLFGMSDALRESNWKWALFGFAFLLLIGNNLYAARLERVGRGAR